MNPADSLKQIEFALRLHKQTQEMLFGSAESTYGRGYLDALEWMTGLIETMKPNPDEPRGSE